ANLKRMHFVIASKQDWAEFLCILFFGDFLYLSYVIAFLKLRFMVKDYLYGRLNLLTKLGTKIGTPNY
ncbi:hypothetical protein ACJX0J_027811, partial [Zea mays]